MELALCIGPLSCRKGNIISPQNTEAQFSSSGTVIPENFTVIYHFCPSPSSFPHWNPIPFVHKTGTTLSCSPLRSPPTHGCPGEQPCQTNSTERTQTGIASRSAVSQTSNVNKVCRSSQGDADSTTVGKCLQIDSSEGLCSDLYICFNPGHTLLSYFEFVVQINWKMIFVLYLRS